jgi:hypothetical protein
VGLLLRRPLSQPESKSEHTDGLSRQERRENPPDRPIIHAARSVLRGLVRLAPRARDRHSDHRADDGADRSRGNRRGHDVVPLRVRSLGRAYVSSGFEAHSARDLRSRPR